MAKIKYSYQAKQLSKKTEIELCKILDASGIKEALVIRSTRTPEEQAHYVCRV